MTRPFQFLRTAHRLQAGESESDDGFTYSIYVTQEETLTVKVTDVLGRVVYSNVIDPRNGDLMVKTTEWCQGIYAVACYSNGKLLDRQQIIVQRK
jgi:hypothetical protein